MPSNVYYTQVADGGGRSSNTSLQYDPKTGKWVPVTPSSTSSANDAVVNKTPGETTSQVDSQTAAEKKYIEAEFNTLTGEMVLTASEKSIRIKVNDTIQVDGLGSYLSGLYYVTAIRRVLSKDGGYSHSLSLLKNGFGGSLKKSQEIEETRVEAVPKTAPEIKVGDTVKIVGDNAVYSNASDGVKVPDWVKKKTLTVQQISSDGTRVLLQPIFSWTYLSYVQKV